MNLSNKKQMLKKLRKMERDPNNKDYLDQIYYAIGNIHLASKDTLEAIANYETGLEKSTKTSPEKGILLLSMANLYWDLTDYANAGRCYSEAIGLIDKNHKEYSVVKLRSEVLDELSLYTENIQLQDSLQHFGYPAGS
jgi:tetratricopeptide (TPR) repeat protein